MNISDIIRHVVEVNHFDAIDIRVECPLVSGVRVIPTGQLRGQNVKIVLPDGVRVFYEFAQQERRKRNGVFNVIEIHVDGKGAYSYTVHFDNVLQKRTEENIDNRYPI